MAKLNDLKYKELLKLQKKLHKQHYITKEIRDIVEVGLSSSVDGILKDLNLK